MKKRLTIEEILSSHNDELERRYDKKKIKNSITWVSENPDLDRKSVDTEFQLSSKSYRRLSTETSENWDRRKRDDINHSWKTYSSAKMDYRKAGMDYWSYSNYKKAIRNLKKCRHAKAFAWLKENNYV